MEIGVDIRVLASKTHSGIEEYTASILENLIKIAPEVKFKLFLNSFTPIKINYDWIKSPNVELYKLNIPNRFLFATSKIFGQPKVDKLIGGVDTFFSPHFYIPTSKECRRVVTFHDLSSILYPNFFLRKQNFWHKFQLNYKNQAKEADKIISISESTKMDIVDYLDIDSKKVKVIYSGLSSDFTREISELEIGRVKNKYKLPLKYILFFGTLEPRKNIMGIIKAFEEAKKNKIMSDYNLILAGGRGWLSNNVFREIEKSDYREYIKYLGFVDNVDRPAIYKLASLFIYPSFFEGFGFPPLEAMASGVPVITSNTSSLPEVVGDCANLIDPHNPSEIAENICKIIGDKKLFLHYSELGLERSRRFNWINTAKETLEQLKG